MISKFGKKLIASDIPGDVVKRAYDFVEKANIGKGLVGKDAELCRSFKDFAATAYITGAREQEEGILKKLKEELSV